MESVKWKVESGEWKVEWKVESVKWRVESISLRLALNPICSSGDSSVERGELKVES